MSLKFDLHLLANPALLMALLFHAKANYLEDRGLAEINNLFIQHVMRMRKRRRILVSTLMAI